MRRISQKVLGSISMFSIVSVLAPALAYAQSYRYDYYADDAIAATAFGGVNLLIWCCICCLPLLVSIIIAVYVYKDAKKNNVENPILWALVSFTLVGLLIYFLSIRPDAQKRNQGLNSTVNEVKETVQNKVEEIKDEVSK